MTSRLVSSLILLSVFVKISHGVASGSDDQRSGAKQLDSDCDNEGSCFKCFIGSETNYDLDNYCFSSANNCTMTVAPDGSKFSG